MSPIHIIVAVDKAGGIGRGGDLPWKLDQEWEHFLRLTTRRESDQDYVCWVMGRKTWDKERKPGGLFEMFVKDGVKLLKIVMTKSKDFHGDELSFSAASWDKVIEKAEELSFTYRVSSYWNIGGPSVYESQLESNRLLQSRLYLTTIEHEFNCDAFFPNLKIFGLSNIPTFNMIKTPTDFKLVETTDPDVPEEKIEESGIYWTCKVLEFVK